MHITIQQRQMIVHGKHIVKRRKHIVRHGLYTLKPELLKKVDNMPTKEDIKKLEKLKKKALKAQKVYEDLDGEYFRTHYRTDKEYKALWDAQQAYNGAFDEYVLTKLEIYYRDKEKDNAKKG